MSLLLALTACVDAQPGEPDAAEAPAIKNAPSVKTGAAVLAYRDFDLLAGKRVGLVTNHTAVVDSVHLIDLLHRHPDVDLVALFGPEHGLRGLEEAGDQVSDGRDPATGLPVYSLYGTNRHPPDSVLEELDALVFDIQDVGARFYTYISTMGYAMQAAAKSGVEFVVLDRPNPLGRRVEGPVREPGYESFVGLYPIPITHGMTVGELAVEIQRNGWLDGLENLNLRVVGVDGWDDGRRWPETGLPWIPTSPNIPDFETALVYPGTCLFEGTIWSEGRGTLRPFLQVGYPGIDGVALSDQLNAASLPGVRFEDVRFTPEPIEGMASNPKHEGIEVRGVRIVVTDYRIIEPVRTGIHLVESAYGATPDSLKESFFDERWFDLLAGTDSLRLSIVSGGGSDR